jgi:hypothetical protein
MTISNPRATIGSNEAPDYAEQVTKQLAADYAEIAKTAEDLLVEARALPKEVDSDETMGIYAALVKRFKDCAARAEAFRIKEKEPFLRGGNAVDNFFNAIYGRCVRADKKAKPGAADVLMERIDVYQKAKAAAERARLEAERREAERVAREAREAAEKAQREADEAARAAERARKPETVQERLETADKAAGDALGARVEAANAMTAADDARLAVTAKTADLVRTRTDTGALVTMAQVGYVEIVDADLLDKNKLWPFLSMDAKEKALRAWAKTTGYKIAMIGAIVELRDETVIR